VATASRFDRVYDGLGAKLGAGDQGSTGGPRRRPPLLL